jgi:uncharacterized protein YerC
MRTSNNKLNPILKKQIEKTFLQLLADLKTADDVEKFLKDFLSETELETLAKRLAVVYWLKKGRGYENIKENLKVSSVTITTVKGLMKKQGLTLGLKKVEAEEWATTWAERIKKLTG